MKNSDLFQRAQNQFMKITKIQTLVALLRSVGLLESDCKCFLLVDDFVPHNNPLLMQ